MPKTTLLIVLLTVAAFPAGAETPDETLRRDIEALKQGQEALRRDLEDLRKRLQARQMPPLPPPVQAIDAVVAIGDAPRKGRQDAKLTLIEFSDYQCPFCKRHAQNTLPRIDEAYIATGKLRYVFRDFPLTKIHPQAHQAAEAAHCAGDQGQYWAMHARLFANQQALAPDNLLEHARAIGLQIEPFKQCLDGGKHAERVQHDLAEGRKLGISSTPTLLLGTSAGDQVKAIQVLRGARPFAAFQQEIDKLLEGASEKTEKTGNK